MESSRRQILATLGAGTVTTVAGCGSADNSGNPSSATDGSSNDETDSRENSSTSNDDQTNSSPPSDQSARLVPSDSDGYNNFGRSVGVSGDGKTAVIGAFGGERSNSENGGSAYVFTRSGGDWNLQTELLAEDATIEDFFGFSVEISSSGNTIIIGAIGGRNANGERTGSAYVFKQSDGNWLQRAKLTAGDGNRADRFGSSVSVSADGSTAIVGAIGDAAGEQAGSAYVYEQSGEGWEQQIKITADEGDRIDRFANSVGVSGDGDTAIIGGLFEDDTAERNDGSAYVYTKVSGNWEQQTKLAVGSGYTKNRFGGTVGLSGDGNTAIVGIHRDASTTEDVGSTYVFTQSNGEWQEQVELTSNDSNSGNAFGYSVEVSDDGETALVTAPNDEGPDTDFEGSVYVFTASDGNWEQQDKLVSTSDNRNGQFGTSTAISGHGEIAIIGAFSNDPSGELTGSAYVFN